jgi:hypothetical protein
MTDSALDDSQLSEQYLVHLRQKGRQVRELILDYGLGVAILGLNPFPGFLSVTLLISSVLILKMLRDIAATWGFLGGQDWLAIASSFFGAISSFWLAIMVWGTLLVLGLFLHLPGSFAVAAGLFTLTCGLGQATNQFYASGWRLDQRRLDQRRWWRF